jgi:tetratricopeptide (TPR) repeat protein
VTAEPEKKQPQEDNRDLKDQNPGKNQDTFEVTTKPRVNISNIVADFKKTLIAIDAPKDINEEVSTYLQLVNTQSLKESPSPKIIRSNLMNAAGILDEYITSTLNKPSKVVTNWIDALLLQKVDYKAQSAPEIALPQTELTPAQPQQVQIQEFSNPFAVNSAPPKNEDKTLQKLYSQAEKLVDNGKFNKAIKIYDKLLSQAEKNGNKNLKINIYVDLGYIYDVNKNFPKALENYNNAATTALEIKNFKLGALAHYNMASIYDDCGQNEAAIEHYYEALALDGQTNNLKAQTNTLNDVGNVFSSIKDYRQAIAHYNVGLSLAKQTKDLKGRGFLLSNMGCVFKGTGKDKKALELFKKSIQCDVKIGNLEGCSINYELAGDIMSKNNKIEKAETLYKKSLQAAEKLGNQSLTSRILDKLGQNNISY